MVINLTEKIKVIMPQTKPVFPYGNSVYIDDDVRAILDTGTGGKAYADIPVENIKLVLLTHNHFDHINGVSFFKNAEIMAGQEEAKTYSDSKSYWEHMGMTEWKKLMSNVAVADSDQRFILPDDVPIKPGFNLINLNGIFADGDEFDLGKTKVTAIHTPGHSKGHYAFYFAGEGILFSGDIDLAPRGPWYGGGSADLDELIKSVEKILEIKPRIMVTSHRRKIFNSKEDDIPKLLRQYLDEVLRKEEQMLEYLSEPHTIDEISRKSFTEYISDKAVLTVFWSKMMATKHLQRLMKLGLIKRIDSNYYVRAEKCCAH